MDYGQPVNTPNETPFFTAGAGSTPENLNPDAENSLNTGIYSPNYNPQTIGNTAMFSSEQAPVAAAPEITTPEAAHIPETPYLEDPNNQELGQNQEMNFELPPTEDAPKNIIQLDQVSRQNDRISPKTVQACEKATSDYMHNQISPADLEDSHFDGVEAYMKTFGDAARWKGKAA